MGPTDPMPMDTRAPLGAFNDINPPLSFCVPLICAPYTQQLSAGVVATGATSASIPSKGEALVPDPAAPIRMAVVFALPLPEFVTLPNTPRTGSTLCVAPVAVIEK